MSKQFKDYVNRVTTSEMNRIYEELKSKVGHLFCAFDLNMTLQEKEDHGDVDILILLHPDQDVKPIIDSLKPDKYVKNGYCHSFIYNSTHIDFLVSSDPNLHVTKKQYYAFNDLGMVLGIFAKALNFKYGSEGFFKRYKDKRGNWHDLLISINLNPGLQCLGLEPKPIWIKQYQDITYYVSGSVLFDSKMFPASSENKVLSSLANLNKTAVIEDEDYFFKRQFSAKYREVEEMKKEIEEKVYRQSKFNGDWLIEKFGMKPGPDIGKMLKLISDSFGDLLGEVEESLVEAFVEEKLNEN